jgi:hypothetical protein
MSSLGRIAVVVVAFTAFPALGADVPQHGAPSAAPSSPAAKQEKCEHGVQKTLCARCNPKLAAVFKAKGDWCAEHERPESQCVPCHPELAKKGIK